MKAKFNNLKDGTLSLSLEADSREDRILMDFFIKQNQSRRMYVGTFGGNYILSAGGPEELTIFTIMEETK